MLKKVVVVGGGPAGLATAIAARNAGFNVVLADHAVPPIDKACGEGIMPDGLAALAQLGVTIPTECAYIFRGIRFLERTTSVEATFPRGVGYGVRRTVLHDLLVSKAVEAGVDVRWGARVSSIGSNQVTIDGRKVSCDWIVGADGQNSVVRHQAGIGRVLSEQRRFGFRQHFEVRPWTDRVEVYWSDCGQVYVTPVADNAVCVALISSDPHLRLNVLSSAFPALAKRLENAVPSTREQGAITSTRQLDAVTSGNIALVGEASGSVDAITGEGMSLGFQQAHALVQAMRAGDLASYERAHRKIGKTPRNMAKLMMLLGQKPWLRQRVLRALSQKSELFAHMLSIHVGEVPVHRFGVKRALSLGWRVVTAREVA